MESDFCSEQFPECCGIGITTGFYGPLDRDMEEALRESISEHIEENRGRVLVTLAAEQVRKYQPLLWHYRFRQLDRFVNPNSGNRVTLYALNVARRYKFPAWKFKAENESLTESSEAPI